MNPELDPGSQLKYPAPGEGEVWDHLADRHVVPVTPALHNDFPCPGCGVRGPERRRSLFIGIQVLGEYHCTACGADFLRDLPVGFQVDYPLAITPEGRIIDPSGPAEPWSTYREYADRPDMEFKIERRVYKECERVVVLNTLDHLYGHVLLKLLNAQFHIDRNDGRGVVLLVPRMFEWLIPEGVAEAWIVDQRLSVARRWHASIDRFVQEQLPRYKEVFLARTYNHPDLTRTDIGRYTGVEPFPLEEFSERPPHITFIARQDRLWFATPLGHFMFRVWRRLGLQRTFGQWFVHAQDRLMKRTMRRIRTALPDATFTVVGLARPGGYGDLAEDLRTERMDATVERRWCEAYARSQVVVGVHGSNMLLPTALAAGCVEVLPHDRSGNIVQDIAVRYNDRMQVFMYRFVDEYASPGDVARHVKAMFVRFRGFYRDNRHHAF